MTDRGRWAVRTMDTWIPIVDAETDVALQEAATAAGVALPASVRAESAAVVEAIGGHDWRVTEWLHSGPPLVAPDSAGRRRTSGPDPRRAHGLGLAADRISPWHGKRLADHG